MECNEKREELIDFLLALDLVESDYVDLERLTRHYLSEEENPDSLKEFMGWRVDRSLQLMQRIKEGMSKCTDAGR